MSRRHLFIINPIAGKSDASADLHARIEALRGWCDDELTVAATQRPMHAAELVKQAAAEGGALTVYACGGDGTLNEVVNGAAGLANVTLTHVPVGTGNDFLKVFGDETERFRDLPQLLKGEVLPVDLYQANGRYGINIGSVGFDSRVGAEVHRFKRWPLVGSKAAYNLSVMYNIFKGMGMNAEVTVDGQRFEGPFTMVNACNGRYYGGGFYAMPDAQPNDGYLDFLLVKRISRLAVARFIGKYARGEYKQLGDIATHLRGKKLDIVSEKPFPINIDGEMLHGRCVSFGVTAARVGFVVPQGVCWHNDEGQRENDQNKEQTGEA